MIWLCRPCQAYVGVHKNSKDYAPLGRIANSELRDWKKRAHAAFDPLWQNRMSDLKCSKSAARKVIYKWLTKALDIQRSDCHIGMFDVDMCKQTVEVCTKAMDKGMQLKEALDRLNEMVEERSVLHSDLDKSLNIQMLWPEAFDHGSVISFLCGNYGAGPMQLTIEKKETKEYRKFNLDDVPMAILMDHIPKMLDEATSEWGPENVMGTWLFKYWKARSTK